MSDSKLLVCVFGSSSKSTKQRYVEESVELGELIAESGHICVNGAGRFGCMGGLNDGCKSKNGLIKGIIHRQFCVDFKEHPVIKDLLIVDGEDLTERKKGLFDNSDCLIVLPGGCGTFDELWEAVSYSSLGMRGMAGKPICLLNIDGFYDGFLAQMHRAYHDGVLYHDVEEYFHVENTAAAALKWSLAAVDRMRAEIAGQGGKNAKLERVIARSTTISDSDQQQPSTEALASQNKAAGFDVPKDYVTSTPTIHPSEGDGWSEHTKSTPWYSLLSVFAVGIATGFFISKIQS